MSTIASPRQSTTSLSTDHSPRRPSFETTARSQATSPARPARRNKNALRDYYGLKAAAAPADATTSNGPQREAAEPALEITRGEFDTPGFDAEAYVRDTLARESLQGLLKIESGLINDIRALDGEKKALVYDNYSKLITATDTIRRMRTNMDPLTPTTSTLTPAIAHIAETAASLAASLQDRNARDYGAGGPDDEAMRKKERQRQTVRWVLGAPDRLKRLVEGDRIEEATKDWEEVQKLLQKWNGVQGVDEVRQQCLSIMSGDASDNAG
ncbi:MAG: hypothetical protein LQ339_006018 [Xanthoria mediterranea]|nr:MAG: hypothetical protein LQ339_006018 [Xanthoria mediterranea]